MAAHLYEQKHWSTPELEEIRRAEFAAYYDPRHRSLLPVKNRWGGLNPIPYEIHTRVSGNPVLIDLLLDCGGGARWWRCCFEVRRSVGGRIFLALSDRHPIGAE